MGMLEICSYNSYWNGLDYFENKRVNNLIRLNHFEFKAQVQGTKIYDVYLNVNHPKKSTCSCPHAEGKTKICKHKVAVYFFVFQDEAKKAIDERKRYYLELEEREKEYEKKVNEERKRIKEYVNSLSDKEARHKLVNYMLNESIEYLNLDNPFESDEW